jgi:hypothetical protein
MRLDVSDGFNSGALSIERLEEAAGAVWGQLFMRFQWCFLAGGRTGKTLRAGMKASKILI